MEDFKETVGDFKTSTYWLGSGNSIVPKHKRSGRDASNLLAQTSTNLKKILRMKYNKGVLRSLGKKILPITGHLANLLFFLHALCNVVGR